jgi:hypothetical protein
MSVKEDTMDKKIIHEVKLPRVITVALYAIAIGLLANVFKPVLTAHPAFAFGNESINVNLRSPISIDLNPMGAYLDVRMH